MSYRTIELKDGSEYACNSEGQGLFKRKPDGIWQQLYGTGQTPTFETIEAFTRWLRKNFRKPNGEPLAHRKPGCSYGWGIR